jgi:hypothetical protein
LSWAVSSTLPYLASDLEHGREVVVKVFRAEPATVPVTGRVFQEIEIAANLITLA